MKASPGGDKISLRLTATPTRRRSGARSEQAGAAGARASRRSAPTEDHRYEAQLVGVGDELMHGLQEKLGDAAPSAPLRVEWVGPKAGKQLRDAAIKALLYAIVFIMVYVAFRFDLRFAPGGVIALFHDALIVLGVYVLLQKEVTLGDRRRGAHHRRLLDQRHGRRLRPHPREHAAHARRDAVRSSSTSASPRPCRARSSPRA